MAVLFDLDGTILGAKEQKIDIMKECTEKIGVREISRDEYLDVFGRVIGSGKIDTRKPVLEEILGDGEQAERLAEEYKKRSLEVTFVYPDAEEVLQKLDGKKALVSNGPRKTQWEKIERFDLQKYFESIIISGEIGIAKPDPRIYQFALDELSSNGSDSYFVGDVEDTDILGANRAGLKSVFIKRNESQSSTVADYVIEDMRDLFHIVKNDETKK